MTTGANSVPTRLLGGRDNPLELVAPMVVDTRTLPAQLAQRIRQMISDGLFRTGGRLPSEGELSDHFRVGRTTVREALKELEGEGLVVVRRGQGRFVSAVPPLRQPIARLEGVTELLASHGYNVGNRIISVATHPPTADERTNLGLGDDDQVIRLERLRLNGDDPLIYSIDVFATSFFPDAEVVDWRGSLFALLAERGTNLVQSVTTIRAANLPPQAEIECGIDVPYPWLLMVQLNLDEDGQPVVYSHDYHRGDRFTFDVLRRVEDQHT